MPTITAPVMNRIDDIGPPVTEAAACGGWVGIGIGVGSYVDPNP